MSLNVLAQERGRTVSLHEVVTFSIPAGCAEMSLAKLESSKKQGKISELKPENANSFKGSVFAMKESKMILTGGIGKMPTTFLEDNKKGFDKLIRQSASRKGYSSMIRSYNNYRVLIMNYDGADFSYCRFTALNNSYSSVVGGVVEYTKPDKAEVDKFVDEFFKGLKFKT